MTGAAERADTTPPGLIQWAEVDDRRLGLLADTVQAAWRTLDERKVEALTGVLADGARDDARLDVDRLIARAVASMEAAHIQVLRVMRDDTNTHTPREQVEPYDDWYRVELAAHLPHLGEGVWSVAADLFALGCLSHGRDAYGDRPLIVAPFGLACLRFLVAGGGTPPRAFRPVRPPLAPGEIGTMIDLPRP